MNEQLETREGEDPADSYDSKHGKTTAADEAKPVNLSESANKPSPGTFPGHVR